MAPRDFAIGGAEAILLHELRQIDGAFARHIGRARAEPVELDPAAFHGFELFLKCFIDRLWSRAEDSNVGERAWIVIRRGDRMAAAHREPRNRAVVLGCKHAEALLD